MLKKIFLILFIVTKCFTFTYAQPIDSAYISSVEQWHQSRIKSLKGENGWLNVVGLFWLKEGENTFGSSKKNNIVFPEGKCNEDLGVLVLKNGTVYFKSNPYALITINDEPFKEDTIFDDKWEKPLILKHKKLIWFIIKRGNKYAIRLRDLESDALKNFTTITRYPTNEKWRVVATLQEPQQPKKILINDIIGNSTPTPFAGTLYFELNEQKFQLDATLEGDKLFIVFADETNGHETYGGGRFLYADKPLSGNKVILDFNKAYNPPCCFTNYATCPIPTIQNNLKTKITAGEKSYGTH
ncbi:MAG: DUF1684 domain-containing protein [Bacteroidia bacterium]